MPNPLGYLLRHRRAGQDALAWSRPELEAPETFALTSPAFDHGAPIPEMYRGRVFAHNISPALAWTAPPTEAVELVLIVEDPDAPMGKPALHALTVGIDPALGSLDEDDLAHPSPKGLRHGRGVMGRRGWAGPMPPGSHGPHTYVFELFALDRRLGLGDKYGLDDLLTAMSGHVLARARLDGTYENR